MQNDEILTVTDLADYLRVHRSTIYRMLRLGEIPAFKVGSDWRFLRSAINQWANHHSVNGLKAKTGA